MKDLTIVLENRPGALAEMGEALGRARVSIEGGGAWVVDGHGIAHFLFADGEAARRALEAAKIRVLAVRDVLVQRLEQGRPGQLGEISRKMAQAGVNIEVIYSDHDHQLILVVDDMANGRNISEAWMKKHFAGHIKRTLTTSRLAGQETMAKERIRTRATGAIIRSDPTANPRSLVPATPRFAEILPATIPKS